MNRLHGLEKNEEGFVLVTALVMLVVLTLLGTFAVNTADFELLISGNDRVAKQTFYQADGASQSAFELLEENLGCPGGFQTTGNPAVIGGIDVFDSMLAYHEKLTDTPNSPTTVNVIPSDVYRSVRIPVDPANRNDTLPRSNIVAYGNSEYLPGSGLQMAAGYEGKGKGSAGAGAVIKYDLHAQHIGTANSEAKIVTNWHHMIGQEGSCNY